LSRSRLIGVERAVDFSILEGPRPGFIGGGIVAIKANKPHCTFLPQFHSDLIKELTVVVTPVEM
jgi:hypothetical protein